MRRSEEFDTGVQAAVPSLRAFAVSLSGNVDRADDLVQETITRAFANWQSFTSGTNLRAWLFTILKNHFRSDYRARRREVEDVDGKHSAVVKTPPGQVDHIRFSELQKALRKLPHVQREAILLVGASGFSYEEAARIAGVPEGTIKSRVHRARLSLAELIDWEMAINCG